MGRLPSGGVLTGRAPDHTWDWDVMQALRGQSLRVTESVEAAVGKRVYPMLMGSAQGPKSPSNMLGGTPVAARLSRMPSPTSLGLGGICGIACGRAPGRASPTWHVRPLWATSWASSASASPSGDGTLVTKNASEGPPVKGHPGEARLQIRRSGGPLQSEQRWPGKCTAHAKR